ncbi:MAG: hypothetical protein EBY16_04190 [Gammaproteobacteria bacterium]|nr:hypothetical protein [Gammaproteobacteria bacterium]
MKIRTTNLAERINREIKRRTQVASIFPCDKSCECLITAVLAEIDDEWLELNHIYLKIKE